MTALIFSQSTLSSIKATDYIKITSVVNIAQAQIKEELLITGKLGNIDSRGELSLLDVTGNWSARAIMNEAAPPLFDIDKNQYIEQKKKYYLWEVELQLSTEKASKRFIYKEVSWNEK